MLAFDFFYLPSYQRCLIQPLHRSIALGVTAMRNPFHFARFLIAGLLLACAALASAEPSIDDIYKAASSGNMPQAEAMMGEVLRAHPNSGKAHFIHAEILAKENRIAEARAELSQAEQLQPGLTSLKPAAVTHLKQKLYPNGSPSASHGGSSLLMWGGLIVLVLVIVMVVRALGRRANPNYNAAAYGPQAYGGQNPPMSGNPGYPYPPQGGGMGSGIMGGLATGAAIGAGVVAGEALMRNVLGDHPQEHGDEPNRYANQPAPDNYDMGGNDFGANDTNSWDDSGSSWSDSSSDGDSGDWS